MTKTLAVFIDKFPNGIDGSEDYDSLAGMPVECCDGRHRPLPSLEAIRRELHELSTEHKSGVVAAVVSATDKTKAPVSRWIRGQAKPELTVEEVRNIWNHFQRGRYRHDWYTPSALGVEAVELALSPQMTLVEAQAAMVGTSPPPDSLQGGRFFLIRASYKGPFVAAGWLDLDESTRIVASIVPSADVTLGALDPLPTTEESSGEGSGWRARARANYLGTAIVCHQDRAKEKHRGGSRGDEPVRHHVVFPWGYSESLVRARKAWSIPKPTVQCVVCKKSAKAIGVPSATVIWCGWCGATRFPNDKKPARHILDLETEGGATIFARGYDGKRRAVSSRIDPAYAKLLREMLEEAGFSSDIENKKL